MSQTPAISKPQALPSSANKIELDSNVGPIVAVKVFANKAEIRRRFSYCLVKQGQNELSITCLPKDIDRESVRLEGNGSNNNVTIYGVKTSMIPSPPQITSSDALEDLSKRKKIYEKEYERAKKSLPTLETYLSLLKIEPLDSSTLYEAMKSYETCAKDLDQTILELENKLAQVNVKISEEKTRLPVPTVEVERNLKATIGISATVDEQINFTLIYVVQRAGWKPEYDIYVDTNPARVTLVYKGGITQTTGEDWNNVSVALETAIPIFHLEVPALTPVNVPIRQIKTTGTSSMSSKATRGQPRIRWKFRTSPNEASTVQERRNASFNGSAFQVSDSNDPISIPSGEVVHNVTIFQNLAPEAAMSYVCVPKKDTKAYLNANIKNSSSYAFLRGKANVYKDGQFISKSDVPFVGPGGNFDCLVCVEPSIRVIYYPSHQKIHRRGFFTKSINYVFSQRITVSSTQMLTKELKIIDQAPIPQDSDLKFTVNMISPKLGISGEGFGGGLFIDKWPQTRNFRVGVDKDGKVFAQWHGSDEAEVQIESLGRDGKLNWVCKDVQASIELSLRWQVKIPSNVKTDVQLYT